MFKGFPIFSLSDPLKGPIKLIWHNLIKDYPRMLHTKLRDHPSISSVEKAFKGIYIFSFSGP
jgi:hypothetical protein